MMNIAFRLIYFSKLCSGNTIVSLKELKTIIFVLFNLSLYTLSIYTLCCSVPETVKYECFTDRGFSYNFVACFDYKYCTSVILHLSTPVTLPHLHIACSGHTPNQP